VVCAYAGGWVLNMRTVMVSTIGEDYVTMAHAKGLRDRRVMTRYAGRNAILPPLNGFAALFASAVGGRVFVEHLLSEPGAGHPLRNRKSRLGLAMVLFMVVVALIAPLISVAHPNDFNLLAARQAPSWHHLFGTTDQGSDIFS